MSYPHNMHRALSYRQCEKYVFVRKGKGKGGKKKPQDLPAARTPGKQFRDLSSCTGSSSSTLETGSEMARHPACNSTRSLLAWTVIRLLLTSHAGLCYQSKTHHRGFPGGAVVDSLPANAGDAGSGPGLGGSHMPRSSWAREPQLLSLRVWSLCSATRGPDGEGPAHRDEE